MINRISEIPFWGPEEQIRRFINQHDENLSEDTTQSTITQQRIENLDEIYQKQLIWSYGIEDIYEAYFYQDWCPIGDSTTSVIDPKWQMELWGEVQENLKRERNRTWDYNKFVGYTKSEMHNEELPAAWTSVTDLHSRETSSSDDPTKLDVNTLRHNIMRSYLEVSEWLGDGATEYGSHNGYVSRKMSLAWLFNAIRALINWKLAHLDRWKERDIHPLDVTTHKERFLNENETSDCGLTYNDQTDLDQRRGRCAVQAGVRSADPVHNGVLKVRGNEYHYGERADFYTHNSFIGECRFFHNARFLGQTTFDKEINGTALRSRWADLAEYKEGDMDYLPGTLVRFGGDKEVTLSDGWTCHAIVTSNPGLILNGAKQKGKCMVGIALTGTVPVRVDGEVRKFDRLVPSSRLGFARKRRWYDFFKKTIGIAMGEAKDEMVECVTKMEF